MFEQEPNHRTPDQWYTAQLTYETWALPYRVWGQAPPAEVTVESFMLKFGTKEEIDERAAHADEERTRHDAEVAKVALMSFFGIDPETGKSRRFETKLPPGMGSMTAPAGGTPAPPVPPGTAPPPAGFTPVLKRRQVWTSKGLSSG